MSAEQRKGILTNSDAPNRSIRSVRSSGGMSEAVAIVDSGRSM